VEALAELGATEKLKELLDEPDYIGHISSVLTVDLLGPDRSFFWGRTLGKNEDERAPFRDVAKDRSALALAERIAAAVDRILDKSEREGNLFMAHRVESALNCLVRLEYEGVVALLHRVSAYHNTDRFLPDFSMSMVRMGYTLPGARLAELLIPIMKEREQNVRSDRHNKMVIRTCVEVLLRSDEPGLGISAIDSLSGDSHRLLNDEHLLATLGKCDNEQVGEYLADWPFRNQMRPDQHRDWIEALGLSNQSACRKTLLGLLDEVSGIGEQTITWEGDSARVLFETIAKIAETDEAVWSDLVSRCERANTPNEANAVSRILKEICNEEAAVLACNLVLANGLFPMEILGLLEEVMMERRPAGGDSYYHYPKSCNAVRDKLCQLIRNFQERHKGYYRLLAFMASYRVEHGRPIDEPRIPDTALISTTQGNWLEVAI
jgi:hypothetical protein